MREPRWHWLFVGSVAVGALIGWRVEMSYRPVPPAPHLVPWTQLEHVNASEP
jgi:hypothetical protein